MSTSAKPTRAYWYTSISWLIREAPSILGERSIQGAIQSALTSGGAGHSVPSSDEHHGHLIERLRLDAPQNAVAKYRGLQKVWDALSTQSKLTLEVYYTPRQVWSAGFEAFIGVELASVAMAFPPSGDLHALRDAVSKTPKNKKLILQARRECEALIRDAHEEWDSVRRIVDPQEPRDIRRKAKKDTEAELA